MPAIYSLRASLTEQEAIRILAPQGVLGRVQRWQRGHLRAVAAVYIPYRLYRMLIDDRGTRAARYYAVDAASGLLDPYEFPEPPETVEVTTRNTLTALLEEPQTRERAIEKFRRRLYAAGFFRLRNPALAADLAGPEFHVPYWVGFFGAERDMKIAVVDAMRHSIEGGKVRRLMQGWLSDATREESGFE